MYPSSWLHHYMLERERVVEDMRCTLIFLVHWFYYDDMRRSWSATIQKKMVNAAIPILWSMPKKCFDEFIEERRILNDSSKPHVEAQWMTKTSFGGTMNKHHTIEGTACHWHNDIHHRHRFYVVTSMTCVITSMLYVLITSIAQLSQWLMALY